MISAPPPHLSSDLSSTQNLHINDHRQCSSYKTTSCTVHGFDNATINQLVNPLMHTVAIWVIKHSIKHPVPDRVKPSFVIFDIRAF